METENTTKGQQQSQPAALLDERLALSVIRSFGWARSFDIGDGCRICRGKLRPDKSRGGGCESGSSSNLDVTRELTRPPSITCPLRTGQLKWPLPLHALLKPKGALRVWQWKEVGSWSFLLLRRLDNRLVLRMLPK